MKVTLFAHGTRGDVAPVVTFGWLLARQGHQVTMAVPGEFCDFANRAGLSASPLPLNMMAGLRSPEGQRMLNSGGMKFMRQWASDYVSHADDLDSAHLAAAEGADVLLSNHLTADRAVALGEAMRIPVSFYTPFPLAPSREYAPFVVTRGKLRSPTIRWAAHHFTARLWWRQNAAVDNSFRKKLGLDPESTPTLLRIMRDQRYLVLYALSRYVFPRPSDWPEHARVSAPWKTPEPLRSELGESLPEGLVDWIEAGDPPVFMGFGSMPVIDPEPLLDDIVAVTRELGLRAVVSENCVPSGVDAGELPDHLSAVGTVDHDRLFPHCSAAVHHGGIGSVHTSLGAGIPTMVCSVMGDQPWWGEHMKRLGVGAHLPFRKLSRAALRDGLRVLRDPATRSRAHALGADMQIEGDGLSEAGRHFDTWLESERPGTDGALTA